MSSIYHYLRNRYNAKLFTKFTMEAMLRSWDTLAINALRDIGQNINLVPVVSDVDKDILLNQWNMTSMTFPDKEGKEQLGSWYTALTYHHKCFFAKYNRSSYSPLHF